MMHSEMAIAQDWPQEKERAAAKQTEVQTLLLEYRQAVFHFCLGFARDRAAAQDLTQETFRRAGYIAEYLVIRGERESIVF